MASFTSVASLMAASLSSSLFIAASSDTSGFRFAIRSRTTASLEAEFSSSRITLISSSGSGGSPSGWCGLRVICVSTFPFTSTTSLLAFFSTVTPASGRAFLLLSVSTSLSTVSGLRFFSLPFTGSTRAVSPSFRAAEYSLIFGSSYTPRSPQMLRMRLRLLMVLGSGEDCAMYRKALSSTCSNSRPNSGPFFLLFCITSLARYI
uniref:Putative secreted protein n=1 Tax=Anopheles triannulatus TaxID=58253 RepID=A0A2M4B284_9DIPT